MGKKEEKAFNFVVNKLKSDENDICLLYTSDAADE